MSKTDNDTHALRSTPVWSIRNLYLSPLWALFAIVMGGGMALTGAWIAPERGVGVHVALALVLAWLAAIDLDRLRLPDMITLPMIAAGLLYAYWTDAPWMHHVIGVVIGYGSFRGISLVSNWILKRPALGLGDAKLLAVFGAWLGWAALPTIVLIGSLAGIVHAIFARVATGQKSAPTPFGFSLIAGFWCVWLVGPIGGWPY